MTGTAYNAGTDILRQAFTNYVKRAYSHRPPGRPADVRERTHAAETREEKYEVNMMHRTVPCKIWSQHDTQDRAAQNYGADVTHRAVLCVTLTS